MQLRHFVSGSSVIILAWLAVTFLRQVPAQRYPKLQKYPTATITKTKSPTAAILKESAVFPVSASR